MRQIIDSDGNVLREHFEFIKKLRDESEGEKQKQIFKIMLKKMRKIKVLSDENRKKLLVSIENVYHLDQNNSCDEPQTSNSVEENNNLSEESEKIEKKSIEIQTDEIPTHTIESQTDEIPTTHNVESQTDFLMTNKIAEFFINLPTSKKGTRKNLDKLCQLIGEESFSLLKLLFSRQCEEKVKEPPKKKSRRNKSNEVQSLLKDIESSFIKDDVKKIQEQEQSRLKRSLKEVESDEEYDKMYDDPCTSSDEEVLSEKIKRTNANKNEAVDGENSQKSESKSLSPKVKVVKLDQDKIPDLFGEVNIDDLPDELSCSQSTKASKESMRETKPLFATPNFSPTFDPSVTIDLDPDQDEENIPKTKVEVETNESIDDEPSSIQDQPNLELDSVLQNIKIEASEQIPPEIGNSPETPPETPLDSENLAAETPELDLDLPLVPSEPKTFTIRVRNILDLQSPEIQQQQEQVEPPPQYDSVFQLQNQLPQLTPIPQFNPPQYPLNLSLSSPQQVQLPTFNSYSNAATSRPELLPIPPAESNQFGRGLAPILEYCSKSMTSTTISFQRAIASAQPHHLIQHSTVVNTSTSASHLSPPILPQRPMTSMPNYSSQLNSQANQVLPNSGIIAKLTSPAANPSPPIIPQLPVNSTPNPTGKVCVRLGPKSPLDAAVQPWLESITRIRDNSGKEISVAINMKTNPICLKSQYKCMGRMCQYHTDLGHEFLHHLENCQIFAILKCPYCNFKVDSTVAKPEALLIHMNSTHSLQRFACTKCFYRAISPDHVKIHFARHHSSSPNTQKYFEISNIQQVNALSMYQLTKSNAYKIVKEIECSECSHQFYCYATMFAHLKTVHATSPLLNQVGCSGCHIQIINEEYLMDHLLICKKKYLYNCSVCQFGCQDEMKMCAHLADFHPKDMFLFYKRAKILNRNNHVSLIEVLYRVQ